MKKRKKVWVMVNEKQAGICWRWREAQLMKVSEKEQCQAGVEQITDES